MQRRDFIKSIVAAGASAAVGRRAHAVPQGWREFEITYVITLKGRADRLSDVSLRRNPDGNEDSLDPTTFAYVISSKEIA